APVVLEQVEPVERLRQIAELFVSGKIGRVIGQRPRVEHVLGGHLVPPAGHQIMPGETAHGGRRHGNRRRIGSRVAGRVGRIRGGIGSSSGRRAAGVVGGRGRVGCAGSRGNGGARRGNRRYAVGARVGV